MIKIDVASKENVAKRLKWLREYLELTQVEMAASVETTPTLYNNWERGRQRLSLEGALRINAIYGTTLDFLFLDRREDLPKAMLKDLSSQFLDNNSSTSSDNPEDTAR